MNTELWVKNGYVFTGEGFRFANIKIKNGLIEDVHDSEPEPPKEKESNSLDAECCLVVPGFIDSHVHFNDPGRTEWEGIETGSTAAAIGGTTTIFDMPLNCTPSVTNLTNLQK